MKAFVAHAELILGLNKGLVGYWKFDEGTGAVASDSSGHGFNGTLSTGVIWVPGRSGKAVFFDGKNSCVTLANSPEMDSVQAGNYTLAAWYHPNSNPPGKGAANNAKHGILLKSGSHTGLSYGNGGDFEMHHFFQEGGVFVGGRAKCPPGAWYFVVAAVSKTEGTVKLYVNGVLDNTGTFVAGKNARDYGNTTWKVGIGNPDQKEYRWPADGAADEVRIYKRCLNETEIKMLFEGVGK